jgi:type IV secretory pathway TrbD component
VHCLVLLKLYQTVGSMCTLLALSGARRHRVLMTQVLCVAASLSLLRYRMTSYGIGVSAVRSVAQAMGTTRARWYVNSSNRAHWHPPCRRTLPVHGLGLHISTIIPCDTSLSMYVQAFSTQVCFSVQHHCVSAAPQEQGFKRMQV